MFYTSRLIYQFFPNLMFYFRFVVYMLGQFEGGGEGVTGWKRFHGREKV